MHQWGRTGIQCMFIYAKAQEIFCKHVGAVLYQPVEYKELNLTVVPENKTCTDILQKWHVPGEGQNKMPIKISELTFYKADVDKDRNQSRKRPLVTGKWGYCTSPLFSHKPSLEKIKKLHDDLKVCGHMLIFCVEIIFSQQLFIKHQSTDIWQLDLTSHSPWPRKFCLQEGCRQIKSVETHQSTTFFEFPPFEAISSGGILLCKRRELQNIPNLLFNAFFSCIFMQWQNAVCEMWINKKERNIYKVFFTLVLSFSSLKAKFPLRTYRHVRATSFRVKISSVQVEHLLLVIRKQDGLYQQTFTPQEENHFVVDTTTQIQDTLKEE